MTSPRTIQWVAKLCAPSDSFVQVSAGYSHTCGPRTDGTVTCWGNPGAQILLFK
jgi:hypothetical protein